MANDLRCIYIIDSPDDGDFFSERREGISVESFLKLRPDAQKVKTNFFTVVNEAKLGETVKEISTLVATAPHYPIIHLSCHAGPKGITLTAGPGITWDVLAKLFEPLTKVTGRSWILCLSACEGIHAEKMQAGGQLIYEALVAPTIKPYPDEAALAYSVLYHLFLTKGLPLGEAVDAMNAAAGFKAGTFVFVPKNAVKMAFPPARK